YFSAAEYKKLALEAIADIGGRGKLPILVGGTGLYIDAVVYNFRFRRAMNKALRAGLDGLSVDELQSRLTSQGIPLPANAQNPRHLVRSLETGGQTAVRNPLRPDTLLLGIRIEPSVLQERITRRVDEMVQGGLADEV